MGALPNDSACLRLMAFGRRTRSPASLRCSINKTQQRKGRFARQSLSRLKRIDLAPVSLRLCSGFEMFKIPGRPMHVMHFGLANSRRRTHTHGLDERLPQCRLTSATTHEHPEQDPGPSHRSCARCSRASRHDRKSRASGPSAVRGLSRFRAGSSVANAAASINLQPLCALCADTEDALLQDRVPSGVAGAAWLPDGANVPSVR